MTDVVALNGVAVSGANTYYSNLFGGGDFLLWGLHFVWTGTPTGTFTLWKSNKANPSLADDTDWVQETGVVLTNPAGSASKAGNEVGNTAFRYYRVKYVNSASTGNIWLYVHAKTGRG